MEKDPLCISKHNIFVRVHNFELMFIIWFYEFLISKSQRGTGFSDMDAGHLTLFGFQMT